MLLDSLFYRETNNSFYVMFTVLGFVVYHAVKFPYFGRYHHYQGSFVVSEESIEE